MADAETQRYIDWVRKGLKNGKTQSGLADHLGIAHPQISSLLKGTRQIKVSEIPKMAEYLEIPPPARLFPLLGDVGAGGEVAETHWPGGEPDMVEGPEDAPIGTVAVNINGDSLGHGFNGWRAFYANRRDPFDESWIGALCVVGTADGRVLIKWVRRGALGFNLISGNGSVEENVSLLWAAKVIDIKPRF